MNLGLLAAALLAAERSDDVKNEANTDETDELRAGDLVRVDYPSEPRDHGNVFRVAGRRAKSGPTEGCYLLEGAHNVCDGWARETAEVTGYARRFLTRVPTTEKVDREWRHDDEAILLTPNPLPKKPFGTSGNPPHTAHWWNDVVNCRGQVVTIESSSRTCSGDLLEIYVRPSSRSTSRIGFWVPVSWLAPLDENVSGLAQPPAAGAVSEVDDLDKPTGEDWVTDSRPKKFKLGDRVRLKATVTKETLGNSFIDTWHLLQDRTFVVSAIHTSSSFSGRCCYALHWINRIIEEDWLEASDTLPWNPKRDGRVAGHVDPRDLADARQQVEAWKKTYNDLVEARDRIVQDRDQDRQQWQNDRDCLARTLEACRQTATDEEVDLDRVQHDHPSLRAVRKLRDERDGFNVDRKCWPPAGGPASIEYLKMKADLERAQDDLERSQVQLAGCLVAAEGGTTGLNGPNSLRGANDATPGDYGWSPAFDAVKKLRQERDAFVKAAEERTDSKRWLLTSLYVMIYPWVCILTFLPKLVLRGTTAAFDAIKFRVFRPRLEFTSLATTGRTPCRDGNVQAGGGAVVIVGGTGGSSWSAPKPSLLRRFASWAWRCAKAQVDFERPVSLVSVFIGFALAGFVVLEIAKENVLLREALKARPAPPAAVAPVKTDSVLRKWL